jgi:hypothetical protein
MGITTKKSTIAADAILASAKVVKSNHWYQDGKVPVTKRKPHAIDVVSNLGITANYWSIMSMVILTIVSCAI